MHGIHFFAYVQKCNMQNSNFINWLKEIRTLEFRLLYYTTENNIPFWIFSQF